MNWKRVHTQQVILFIAGSLCGALALGAPAKLFGFFVVLAMLCLGASLVFGLKGPSVDDPAGPPRLIDGRPSPFVPRDRMVFKRTPEEELRAKQAALEAVSRPSILRREDSVPPSSSPSTHLPNGGPIPERFRAREASPPASLPTAGAQGTPARREGSGSPPRITATAKLVPQKKNA